MIARHVFQIHALCPFVDHQWDYYDCEIETREVIDVHQIEKQLNEARGAKASQEDLCIVIHKLFPNCKVSLRGRHNQKSRTVVTCGS